QLAFFKVQLSGTTRRAPVPRIAPPGRVGSAMPTLTIACPACGVHRQCEDAELGQRLQCRCGMSFAASPVFAVPDETPRAGLGRLSGWAVGGSVALFVGCAAAATWLMTRPSAAPPPEPVVATAPGEPPVT